MKRILQSQTVIIGLAIFSMLFGAGNLIFPIKVGLMAGKNLVPATLGFLITSILLPLIGLITIILFDGDYGRYFNRLGKVPGQLLILTCMIVIGPIIGIPRIVILSYTLLHPFIPVVGLLTFSIFFLLITFLGTVRENKILDLLGYIISPLLLGSLIVILAKGLLMPGQIVDVAATPLSDFIKNLKFGFSTLDLLGTIFFGSIVLTIMKQNVKHASRRELKSFAITGLKGGLLGSVLLGFVYVGLSLLGFLHGYGLQSINEGELFRQVTLRIMGNGGSFIVATAVLMACFSTAIALLAVVAEYVQVDVLRGKIGYVPAVLLVMLTSLLPCNLGLEKIIAVTVGPIASIIYPVIIVTTFCNLAYKLIGFRPIKMPVLVTFFLSLGFYLYRLFV
jgi:branched-chain amino acid:cation transporter, LIVCS family